MAPQTLPKPRARLERGASAVEYALLVAGIAAVIVLVVVALGRGTADTFQDTCDALDAAASCDA